MNASPPLPLVDREIGLHQAQLDFRRSQALYRGFCAGRGAGKSWVGAYDLLMRAKRGRTYLIASPTGVLMQDTTFPTVKAIAQDLGLWGEIRISPYPTLVTTTGATVRFRTADDPEKLRGPNLSGAWLDEGSIMHEDARKIVQAALREGGEQGWLSLTFTPKGMEHWTYKMFFDEQGQPMPHTELFRCTTDDNPFLPAEFEKTLKSQYGEGSRYALQELGGQFVGLEGVEWPPEYFGSHIWFDDWPRGDVILKVMALDPSKGKVDRPGDFWCWICLAVDRQWNLWVDCVMDNVGPIEPLRGGDLAGTIVGEGLRLYAEFQPSAIVVEINGFQELVATALARWGVLKGIMLPIWTINNTEPKPARIRQLGPYLGQRRLRIRNTKGGRLLVAQMRDFTGDPRSQVHDDGPDALKMGEQLANHILCGPKGNNGPRVLTA